MRHGPDVLRTSRGALAVIGLLGITAGCGHPATREECEAIMQKSAELTLREQTSDPRVIEDRIAEFTKARGNELLEKCVGRTVTQSALQCVKRAEKPSDVDRCLF